MVLFLSLNAYQYKLMRYPQQISTLPWITLTVLADPRDEPLFPFSFII